MFSMHATNLLHYSTLSYNYTTGGCRQRNSTECTLSRESSHEKILYHSHRRVSTAWRRLFLRRSSRGPSLPGSFPAASGRAAPAPADALTWQRDTKNNTDGKYLCAAGDRCPGAEALRYNDLQHSNVGPEAWTAVAAFLIGDRFALRTGESAAQGIVGRALSWTLCVCYT